MQGEVQLLVGATEQELQFIPQITNQGFSRYGNQMVNPFPFTSFPFDPSLITVGTEIILRDNNDINNPGAIIATLIVTSVNETEFTYDIVSGTIPDDETVCYWWIYSYVTLSTQKYLDLFENESISQNWKFQDLSNFSAQGAFSREFRIPYSENNQQALGALFDVNVTAGTANYFHYKLPAEIRVDTLPIANGYIRVRKVYRQLNRINEVEIAFYAETPDLVRNIGEKKLADLTDLPNLNEVIDYDNVTTPDNNRIWTLLERGELWSETGEANTRRLFNFDSPVYPADLTPALRYDYLFEQIIKDAGFELVGSSLLSILSTYYMPWLNSQSNVAGDSFNAYFFRAYNSASYALTTSSSLININTEIFDNNGDFNGGTASYVTPTGGYYTFRFRNKFTVTGVNSVSYFLDIDGVLIFLNDFNVFNNQIVDFTYQIGIDAGSVVQLKMKKNNPPAVTLVAGDGTFDTSIWELVKTDFFYGQTIYYNLNAPDVKQIDLITDIIKMHNCVIVADRFIPNKIYIVPQSSYFGSGDIIDWTSKLDTSKDLTLSSTVDLQKLKFQFTYTAGEDVISKQYKNVNRVYGDYEAIGYTVNPNTPPSDFLLGDQKIQLTMQSTPCGVVNGTSVVIPMFINEQLNFVAPGMRCLFHAGDVNIELFNDNISFPTVTTTPVLNHYSSVIADLDDYDLNWAPEVPPYSINTNPYNNLFNLYWRNYMNALYSPDARILEAYFALDLKDILTFSFADKVWIQDSYWRILEVSDYKVGNYESTKVVLIKFLDDVEDCSSTPNTISVNGVVNFVDGEGNPVDSTQDCCTRYGYNWDEQNGVCWAFSTPGDRPSNTVSGTPTNPAPRPNKVAIANRSILDSVITGTDVIIAQDNSNMLAVGNKLELDAAVSGSNLLGKNTYTRLPGIHMGGGFKDADITNAIKGYAQHGVVVLHRKDTYTSAGNAFLFVEGINNSHIDLPDETLWSCLLHLTVWDNTNNTTATGQYSFSMSKKTGIAAVSAITALNTTNGTAFTIGIGVNVAVTNLHRLYLSISGGSYPVDIMATASIQYQQNTRA
jgi:hypothetical protein